MGDAPWSYSWPGRRSRAASYPLRPTPSAFTRRRGGPVTTPGLYKPSRRAARRRHGRSFHYATSLSLTRVRSECIPLFRSLRRKRAARARSWCSARRFIPRAYRASHLRCSRYYYRSGSSHSPRVRRGAHGWCYALTGLSREFFRAIAKSTLRSLWYSHPKRGWAHRSHRTSQARRAHHPCWSSCEAGRAA